MSEAGRVIAGSARGTRLLSPGESTRPFGDRVKQALFAILEPDIGGAVVLDLFAGSGAGAIEALSRGAARAVLVERDGGAAATIAENLRRTGLEERGRLVRLDALRYLAEQAPADGPFNIVLVDPPYAETRLLERAIDALTKTAGLLAPGAWVVTKHFWKTPPSTVAPALTFTRAKRFGETQLQFYRRKGPAEEHAATPGLATSSGTEEAGT